MVTKLHELHRYTGLTRRTFLRKSAVAAAGVSVLGCQISRSSPRKLSASEKLNLGVIGTANRAAQDIHGIQEENIAAICDIDEQFLAAAHEKFPAAKTYTDFRKLLEQRDIDAVLVSTADHCHAVATAAALHLGKHVYCEKPLTHTVYEARAIAKLAARNKNLATQMGTQIHATDNYRRVVELVKSGAIGKVSECHVWCEKSLANSERPAEMPPTPAHIHWDLWLGPAPSRPYHPDYLPKTWRHWWDFGEGILGDMACHYMDLAFWALDLKHPLTVEAEGPPIHPETTPEWLVVRYEFPALHGHAPLKVTWYDGGKRPRLVAEGKAPNWRNGVLFVGDKGMLIADYAKKQLLPESQFEGFTPPEPFIPQSIGHHKEWLLACKTGSPTTCNFQYASALTETVLLGNVAYRTGQKLDWDAARLKARNSKQAANYLHTEYRKGWEI
jgi:predicted dehydrogenase